MGTYVPKTTAKGFSVSCFDLVSEAFAVSQDGPTKGRTTPLMPARLRVHVSAYHSTASTPNLPRSGV